MIPAQIFAADYFGGSDPIFTTTNYHLLMLSFAKPLLRLHHHQLDVTKALHYLRTVEILILSDGLNAEIMEHKNVLDTHGALAQTVEPEYGSPAEYLTSRLFLAHIGAFELFLQELATEVVLIHPKKVGSTQFTLSEVLDAPDQTALVERAIGKYLNKLLYEKPSEYRKALAQTLSIESAKFDPEWSIFVEAKARRDLGIHADWKCNATYFRKLKEANVSSSLKLGDSAIPTESDDYFDNTLFALHELAINVTEAVVQKHTTISDIETIRRIVERSEIR